MDGDRDGDRDVNGDEDGGGGEDGDGAVPLGAGGGSQGAGARTDRQTGLVTANSTRRASSTTPV